MLNAVTWMKTLWQATCPIETDWKVPEGKSGTLYNEYKTFFGWIASYLLLAFSIVWLVTCIIEKSRVKPAAFNPSVKEETVMPDKRLYPDETLVVNTGDAKGDIIITGKSLYYIWTNLLLKQYLFSACKANFVLMLKHQIKRLCVDYKEFIVCVRVLTLEFQLATVTVVTQKMTFWICD